eukprot:CAMPEP_0117505588 /NCGR_PEP_ID=MMETSP0784-20121206/25459_1 /TAXON_ID=39447 /ORGANISM="" /LENGTH=240 /DNA_ID=CAMNT_0005301013 /DNA_START=43 /DNA_END=766 /DNA_ORIENTATION=+
MLASLSAQPRTTSAPQQRWPSLLDNRPAKLWCAATLTPLRLLRRVDGPDQGKRPDSWTPPTSSGWVARPRRPASACPARHNSRLSHPLAASSKFSNTEDADDLQSRGHGKDEREIAGHVDADTKHKGIYLANDAQGMDSGQHAIKAAHHHEGHEARQAPVPHDLHGRFMHASEAWAKVRIIFEQERAAHRNHEDREPTHHELEKKLKDRAHVKADNHELDVLEKAQYLGGQRACHVRHAR